MFGIHGIRVMGAVALIGCFCAPAALAAKRPTGTTFGLGTGLHHTLGSDEPSTSPWTVFVPIQFASVRLEPELGLISVSRTNSDGDYLTTEDLTALRIGVGLSYTAWLEDVAVHVGARLGFIRNSGELELDYGWGESDTMEFLRTDVFFSPLVGAELYLTRALSLGLEAQLEMLFEGETQVKDVDGTVNSSDDDRSLINTRGVLFLRLYFI